MNEYLFCGLTVITFIIIFYKNYEYYNHCFKSEYPNHIGACLMAFIDMCLSLLVGFVLTIVLTTFYMATIELVNYIIN